MFQSLNFMFPLNTINLTKQRVTILQQLVTTNGATTQFSTEQFIADKDNAIIIVGADAKLSECQQICSKLSIDFEEWSDIFIKPEWISISFQKKALQPITPYKLFKPELDIMKVEVPIQQDSNEYDVMMPTDCKHSIDMMLEYRYMLDYQYDSMYENFHQQLDDGYEDLLDTLKQENKQEYQQQTQQQQFYGDEDCMIVDVRTSEQHLFDGIDVKFIQNIDDPLSSAPVKYTQMHNPGVKRKAVIWEQKKQYFACEAGSNNLTLNDAIVTELNKLLKIYTNEKDKGRCIAYRKAISFIKSLKFPIRSEEDVMDMPTIGDKIKKKIVEIIQTGRLRKADHLCGLEKNRVIDELSRVWGIGATTAMSLYLKGIKSIADLQKNQHMLNKNQIIGLKYVDEFEQRIPRDEATQIYNIIADQIRLLSDIPDIYEAIACGSYRRGKESCGDVDVLITRKDGKRDHNFMNSLVMNLEKVLLTDNLVVPKTGSHGSETYMGVGRVEGGIHRRIDLKYYPREQFGYAVLYFTGSDHFNRSMRLYAQKKGYSLSDHGIYPNLRGTRNREIWKGELIPCYSEKDVFNFLGLTYRNPEDRSL